MWENKQLDEIQQHIFLGRLGKALNMTQNYVLTFPQRYDTSILQELKNNYQLMTDYWRGGAVDPRRNEVYHKLLRQLNALVTNMMIQDRISHTSSLQSLYKRGEEIRPVISEHLLQVRLEEYVANVAMLEFEQEQQREEKRLRLHQEHQQFMDRLFGYILTSGVWPDWQADAFADILLSPTVDSHDQQLIVSAVMLSAMSVFDFHKFRVLVRVYRDTTDPSLRQRALVGWVFSADSSMAEFYPEMRDMIVRLCDDEQVCKELIELQMQVVFCQNAEDDRQTIQNEIMPDLMKASNLHITRQGIEEKDDDPMRDILHPDAAEEDMERMEQSMNRMMDMQKQGADIYFAGFSQMKRFTFFYDISNWFAPFSPDHPGISHIWQQGKGRKFLHVIMRLGAFCDSDKYSFVLAFEQVLSRLPQQMLQMVEQGEASPMPVGGQVPIEEQRQPAFVRRLYLQNLYRFFRLYIQRGDFVNPFDAARSVFTANPLFRGSRLEQQMCEVASFLIKHNRHADARRVLEGMEGQRDLRYYILMGSLLMHTGDPASCVAAMECYGQALQMQPGHRRALTGYARACFACKNYTEALHTYEQLQSQDADSQSVELNIAVCLTHLQRYEEALKILFKQNYLYPDDQNVMRILAWTLTVDGKYEQAVKLYDQLLSSGKQQVADSLNYGYCLWFKGDVAGAAGMFRQYLSQQEGVPAAMEREFLDTEHELLSAHGISDTEILLMLDFLSQ